MAFSPAQKYPGATEADPNYQDTKFKDNFPASVPNGSPLKSIDRNELLALQEAIMNEAGFEYNGVLDTPQDSQLFKAYQAALTNAEPRNNDWNGYFDPEHQEQLPSPTGYPNTTPTPYGLDDEWSLNCFSGIAGNTISSDADGVVFSGSIYKKYEYTAEQIALIDVDKVPVFIKAQDGKAFYFKRGDTGVDVQKVGTTLTVTLDVAIFGVTGIDKIWRFFVADKVGVVAELSPEALVGKIITTLTSMMKPVDKSGSRLSGVTYTNNNPYTIYVYIWFTGPISGEVAADLSVDGLPISNIRCAAASNAPIGTLSARVPPGSTYICNSSFISRWHEYEA